MKFRIFNRSTHSYDYSSASLLIDHIHLNEYDYYDYSDRNLVIEQCAGKLYDGTYIFEGDVLLFSRKNESNLKGSLRYNGSRCAWTIVDEYSTEILFHDMLRYEATVVGTIHDR